MLIIRGSVKRRVITWIVSQMACSSYSTGGGGTIKVGGSGSKEGRSFGGYNRRNVFDWLQDVEIPDSFAGFNMVEGRFKGGRRSSCATSSAYHS